MTAMERLPSRVTSGHLLLCVGWSLLWGASASNNTMTESPIATSTATNTTTTPGNVVGVQVLAQTENSVTVTWVKVNNISTYVLRYVNKGEFQEDRVNSSTEQPSVTWVVTGLTPGMKYNFTVITVLDGANSTGFTFVAPTAPRNPEEFEAIGHNETSITLQWSRVTGVHVYTLVWNGTETDIRGETHTVSGLRSGTRYTFSLFSVCDNIRSRGVRWSSVTVPPAVSFVNVTQRAETSVTLAWTVVDDTWSYSLHIDGRNVSVDTRGTLNSVSQPVASLRPGTAYPFSVVTVFSGVHSAAYSGFTVTAINCTAVTWHVTNTSIRGAVDGLFSKATATNGSQIHVSPGGSSVLFTGLYPGAAYEVSLTYQRESTHFPQCHHRLTTVPPRLSARCEYWSAGYSIYIVWDEPEGVWTAAEVTVSEKTHTVGEKEARHIKIPGFQPAKTYEVSILSLSGAMRSQPSVFLCPTDPRGVIAGSVFAILLLALLVCLSVFVFLKRPNIIRKTSAIGGFRLSSKRSRDKRSAAKFPHHFYRMSADENRGFSQEYEDLGPVGTNQSQTAADLFENRDKNRFTNVLPYDWCRVKLGAAASDYINASYVPGYSSDTEYIATQGPLPSTVDDFWRMVWEQRVKGIVMVTNCVEGGRTKCEQYWPAHRKSVLSGELLVSAESEQQEPNWTLREFRVKQGKSSEERTVKHFHFTAWPDHGVPQGTDILMEFRGLVRQHMEGEGSGGPTVVHCSAGVGRTGTIIALDVLLQQLDRENAVGVNDFVHRMRLRRPYMVQTESQYVFLHRCIMDHLQPKEKTLSVSEEHSDTVYENTSALREFLAAQ